QTADSSISNSRGPLRGHAWSQILAVRFADTLGPKFSRSASRTRLVPNSRGPLRGHARVPNSRGPLRGHARDALVVATHVSNASVGRHALCSSDPVRTKREREARFTRADALVPSPSGHTARRTKREDSMIQVVRNSRFALGTVALLALAAGCAKSKPAQEPT